MPKSYRKKSRSSRRPRKSRSKSRVRRYRLRGGIKEPGFFDASNVMNFITPSMATSILPNMIELLPVLFDILPMLSGILSNPTVLTIATAVAPDIVEKLRKLEFQLKGVEKKIEAQVPGEGIAGKKSSRNDKFYLTQLTPSAPPLDGGKRRFRL